MSAIVSGHKELTHVRSLVALATYNEIDNLPTLVDAIRALIPHVDLLVVDDNSPDGTGAWVKAKSSHDSHVYGIHRPGKLGLGSATLAAIQFAIERQYDYLVTLDADWSHHPHYIPDLLSAMVQSPNAQVAIGSRYVAGGGVEGWPLRRRIMSRMMNSYARWLLGLTARDCTGAFRCYRVTALARLDWTKQYVQGYAFLEEILWRMNTGVQSMLEVPICFVDRTKGTTKLGWREAIKSVISLAQLRIRNP